MAEQQVDKNKEAESNKPKDDELEIDLMEILRKIISFRKSIYKAAGVGLIIGIIVALSIPKQYTVQVTLSPEMGSSKGGNGLSSLAASFLGSGAAMSEGSDALNATLSADIVSSTPFLLELFNTKVVTSNEKVNMTLESYLDDQSSPWWNYIIGAPSMMIVGVKSLLDGGDKSVLSDTKQGTITLTKKEANKIETLKESIAVSVDKKTAMTSVSVTLQDSKVAATIADSVVHKLQDYIINYRTSKAKEDCAYLEKLFIERQQEYYAAQKKYANYVDSHDNLILQSVRTEQERLQNDMSLAYQVYSQVANQLQVARAKVQEEKPVFAVVEPAVVPLDPSGTSKNIYVLAFIFLSVCFVLFWKLFGEELLNKFKDLRA